MGKSKQGESIKTYLPQPAAQVVERLQILWHLPSNLTSDSKAWMTWQNWGLYDKELYIEDDVSTWKWHLEHIVPHSEFCYTTMDCQEFRDCWDINNLRPYPAKQNIIESNNRTKAQSLQIKVEIKKFLESLKRING